MGHSRRAVLLAGAGLSVAGVAACTGQPAPPDPVTTALKTLLAAEKALAASYDQAVGRFGVLNERVGGVRTDHAAHVKALTALIARRDPEPRPSGSAQPSPAGSLSANSASGARQQLAALERKQAAAAVALCLTANDEDATLLASLAASESSHVEVLT
ncbi:hypothetical protein [Fodinicola acaciae]|uniref:hypothetical protein n=1 Tax=Fodinicola acaciae TaxID=2681555 RepID=UPI0013D219CC|nr:hypothetical protein [Fodinicola acaciae]